MDSFTQILGLTLIVIGFVGFFIAIGFMLYPPFRDYRGPYFGKTPANLMRGGISPSGMLIVLFALIALGVSILVLLADIPAERMTPAHKTLLTVGDGLIKLSIGAILGMGCSWLARGKGKYA